MKAVGASLLLASLCAVSSHSQDLRKLTTLPTPSEVSSVAVCGQSGLVAALGRDGSITVFRLPSAEAVTKRPAEAGLGILACSPDGKLLATSKGDETVVIADISGTALRKFAIAARQVSGLTFSPDSSMLAVQLYEKPTQLWDVAHGVLIAALQTDFSGTGGVDFSPDGSRFATADHDTMHVDANSVTHYTFLVWNLATAKSRAMPVDVSKVVGTGVPQKNQPVIFLRDSGSSLTEWALPN